MFKEYIDIKGQKFEARPYEHGEDLAGVTVARDYQPRPGDVVAKDPQSGDLHLISEQVFLDLFAKLDVTEFQSNVSSGGARVSGCLKNSAPDEPIFVLCARDRAAPAVVREWADRAGALGAPPEKTVGARAIAERMERWQEENPEKVKIPD